MHSGADSFGFRIAATPHYAGHAPQRRQLMNMVRFLVLLVVGGLAAIAQILWAHGVTNRLGEVVAYLAIGFGLLEGYLEDRREKRRRQLREGQWEAAAEEEAAAAQAAESRASIKGALKDE